MISSLTYDISALLKQLGLPATTALSTPPKPEMGDVAIPCFALAKELQKSPVEVAKQLAATISSESYPLFERIEAEGPFLNITFSTAEVAQRVLSYVADNETTLGQDHTVPSERVMIEYSQPNTHKEFHIGHLRNVAIGSTMVRVYRELGYTVRAANYIGDVGAHVAKCLWYIKKFASADFMAMQSDASADRGKWLGQHDRGAIATADSRRL
jgi:arginyl-tRNA synthetase